MKKEKVPVNYVNKDIIMIKYPKVNVFLVKKVIIKMNWDKQNVNYVRYKHIARIQHKLFAQIAQLVNIQINLDHFHAKTVI